MEGKVDGASEVQTLDFKFKQALRAGKQLYGTLVTSTCPKSLEAVQGLGLDCVFIDTEHIPMNWRDLGWMCHAYRGMGMVPIVRIPRADPFDACRVLDTGAGGVVAAYIETPEEVRQLRGATKLRPLKGHRLGEVLDGKRPLDGEIHDYVAHRNQSHILLVNIESVQALNNLDAILSIEGLDGILIGPHDLSCSLGVPEQYDSPIFERAFHEIVTKGRARGVGVGCHNLPKLEQEKKWSALGMNLVLHRSDITLFRTALQTNLKVLRDAAKSHL